LDDVVVVGGWANQLYHFHPKAAPQPDKPLMTTDADIYLRQQQLSHHPKIDARLKEAGFVERLAGSETPPVSTYILPDSKGFLVEFLTEASGSGIHSDGSRNVTVGIEGVTAQKLDYLNVARLQPWQVGPVGDPAYDWPQGVTVKIVNPACYIAQKILIHGRRSLRPKGSKDLLYIYDTIIRFADHLPEMAETWKALQTPQILSGTHVPTTLLSPKDVRTLQEYRRTYFETLQDTHHQAAALIKGAGRSEQASADDILAVLQAGLEVIFGP
jgi:hypothetical protein